MRTPLQLQTARELHRAEVKIGVFARLRMDVNVEHTAAFACAAFMDD